MKKPSLIYLICILLFLYACGTDSIPSEEKTKKEIASIYVAKTTFEDIKNATLGDIKNVHVKNINISRSAILDTMNRNFSINNIALIMYENLSEEERATYDYIGVNIAQENGKENPYSFTLNTLKEIDATKKVAYQFAESIVNTSYKNLEPILATGQNPVEAAEAIKEYFTGMTESGGPIIDYYFYGIGEGELTSKTYYSHLGTLTYKNGVTQNFHVNIFEGDAVTKGYNINPIQP